MELRHWLIADFDQETAATRRLLERAPEQSFTWRPHPRSFSLGELATHLVQLPHWGSHILDYPAYDVASAASPRAALATVAEVLMTFDRHVAEARTRLSERSEAELIAPWALKRGKETMLSMPKLAAFRRFVLHHLIHHRGQLTVYLRELDVPLIALYGPTADEQM